jgi:threonylcarbamoyladenosine tRNA methylthiotransferase MtaB
MNSRTKKVAFHTLGCKLNYAETSTISRQFEAAGYEKIDFSQTADLYVINTCSVTENADREFRKIVNKAKRLSPDSKVAVIGCYAQLRPENIVATSKVDVVLGMKEKFNLLQHLDFDSTIETPLIIQDAEIDELHGCTPSYSVGDRTRSFLKIQDGCDYPCTYCTIPLARGKSRSIDPEILVDQAQEIAERGVKEIVLTGVNVGDYRFGSGLTLIDLLKRLDVVEGIDRIRISSIEPNLLTDEIIDFVSKSKSILPHFHIPLQAGSDKILSLMKRRYGVELYKDRIAAVRSVMPDAGIGVDVIVGFPGESEVEFQETYDLIESLDISYLHVFTYSERPNTDAINMSGKVGMRDRKTRNKRLTQLSERKNQSFALRQLNQSKQVLLERRS